MLRDGGKIPINVKTKGDSIPNINQTTNGNYKGVKGYPRVYFEMLMIGFSIIMGIGLSRAFLPIMAYKLDPTGSLVGFVISAWFLTRIFIELPSGLISVKVGRRRLIVTGLLLGFSGPLLCAFSTSIYLLILGRTLWGFGTALYFTSNTALMFDLFEPRIRGRAVGTFQGIEFIGSFIGAPLGAVLAMFMGFNNVFIISAIIVLFALLIAFFSSALKEADRKAQREYEAIQVKEVLSGLKDWALLGVCYVNLSRMMVTQGVMSTVFQLYLNESLGVSIELIGLLLGARTAGMICIVVISGYLSDRFGRKPVVLLGLTISAAAQYLYTLAGSFEQILPLAILEGVGSGFVFTSLIVYMSDLVPPSLRGGAVGLFRTFMDVGGVLGPVIFMFIYSNISAHASFWFASLVLLSNIGMIALIRRKETVIRE